MLKISAIFLFSIVLLVNAVHFGLVFWFLMQLKQKKPAPVSRFDGTVPRAAIFLTLRGADPFLERCVRGLLTQDYPNYAVFFILDHETDPAFPIVQEIVRQYPERECRLLTVPHHRMTCSLKCDSLSFAAESLPPEFQLIVTVDSDTTPHAGWLRELLEPFSDPQTAAVSGIRWYLPASASWGTLVRALWNTAAVFQQILTCIPWGGSMAIRREVLWDGGLLEVWKHSFADDVPVFRAVQKLGKRVRFIPALLMVNREECTLSDFFSWVQRQLLCPKLSHPRWSLLLLHGFFLSAPLLAALGVGLQALRIHEYTASLWAFGAFALYPLGVLAAFGIVSQSVDRFLQLRGETIPQRSLYFLFKTLLAIPLTQLLYTCALLNVFRLKKVTWRGVCYEVGPSNRIRLLEYRPYAEIAERCDPSEFPSKSHTHTKENGSSAPLSIP